MDLDYEFYDLNAPEIGNLDWLSVDANANLIMASPAQEQFDLYVNSTMTV